MRSRDAFRLFRADLLARRRTVAEAQDWATAMFDHTSHDFGIVAKLAKVEHHFPFKNNSGYDVHIASVQSSCSCTVPELTKDLVKNGETAEVIARIDTRTFNGRREATVRVTIDRPVPAEVQLHVYCYIRSDVVVDPGEINFGFVDRGSPASCKVLVSYAGRLRLENHRRAECPGAPFGQHRRAPPRPGASGL